MTVAQADPRAQRRRHAAATCGTCLPHTLLCRQILGVLHLADAQESTLIRRGAIRDPPGLDKAKRSVFDEQPRVDAAPPRFREGRRILSPELCLGFFDCTCLGSACDQRGVWSPILLSVAAFLVGVRRSSILRKASVLPQPLSTCPAF